MSKLKAVSDFRLSRRTFLKATGAMGAAIASGAPRLIPRVGLVHAQEAEGPTIERSICDMCCIGYCGIECYVESGRITRVQPWGEYPLCDQGSPLP